MRDACGFDDEQLWETVWRTPHLLLVDPADIAERVAWLCSPATSAFAAEFTGDKLAANADLLEQPPGVFSCRKLAAAVGRERCSLHCGLATCGTKAEWQQWRHMEHVQMQALLASGFWGVGREP